MLYIFQQVLEKMALIECISKKGSCHVVAHNLAKKVYNLGE